MFLGELAERLDEARFALVVVVEAGYRVIHEATFRLLASISV
jgi:hypothetical protein